MDRAFWSSEFDGKDGGKSIHLEFGRCEMKQAVKRDWWHQVDKKTEYN